MSSTPHIDVTDLRDAEACVVVVVTWAGRTWRLGEREITFAAGEHVLPGLMDAPEVTDEIDLSGGVGGEVTVSMDLVLPCEDVPALIAAGFDLIDAAAEVSIVWHRGGAAVHAWAARHVVADGDLVGSHYGDPTKPAGWIGSTVHDSPYRRETPIVPLTMAISSSTWPTSTEAEGTRIPWVIGAPSGSTSGSSDGGLPSAPIAVVTAGNADLVLLSYGYVVATQVEVSDDTGADETFAVTYQSDGLGRTCAVADISGAATISRTSGSYVSRWVVGGAAHCPFDAANARPVLLAAELLAMGGADIDFPEWVRVGAWLGGSVAGYLDDPDARAWEVARDLLSPLPIAVHRGDCGWAPVILDPHGASSRYVETVREGEDWRRVSQWQTEEGTARVGQVDAAWAHGTTTVGDTSAYDGPIPHGWVRHLVRPSTASLTLSWAGSQADATRAAAWLARSQALGWRGSAWQVPASRTMVRAGEWVRLIDAAGTTSYALVTRRSLSRGVWDHTLAVPGGL